MMGLAVVLLGAMFAATIVVISRGDRQGRLLPGIPVQFQIRLRFSAPPAGQPFGNGQD